LVKLNVMGVLRGCRAAKFDLCNILWSSVYTIFNRTAFCQFEN